MCTPCLCGCTPLDLFSLTGTIPFPCVRHLHVCMPVDAHSRACTCLFRCLYMFVCLWTFIHVLLATLFRVYAKCPCVFSFAHPPFSMCLYFAPMCTTSDVHPRANPGRVGCVYPVYVFVSLSRCIHVPVQAFFRVYALCT